MKATEIEKLSLEELLDKLAESKKKLLDLKMNHAVSPLENPLQIKIVRRIISRLLTAITVKQKEIIAQVNEKKKFKKRTGWNSDK